MDTSEFIMLSFSITAVGPTVLPKVSSTSYAIIGAVSSMAPSEPTSAPWWTTDTKFANRRLRANPSVSIPEKGGKRPRHRAPDNDSKCLLLLLHQRLNRLDESGDLRHRGLRQRLALLSEHAQLLVALRLAVEKLLHHLREMLQSRHVRFARLIYGRNLFRCHAER